MRKVNKILMATVSILLCLVLISTSVVSGIFAKYVIKKDTISKIEFTKLGVTVDVTVDETALTTAGATINKSSTGKNAKVTITDLKMAPGESIMNAVKIDISGTAGVRLKVVIEPKVVFNQAAFEAIAPSDKPVKFFGVPIGLYYTAYDKNSQKVTKPFVRTWEADHCKFQVLSGCDWQFGSDYDLKACSTNRSWKDTYGWVEKTFDMGDKIVFSSLNDNKTVNQFNFHLMWEDRGTDLFNLLDTVAANANPQPNVQIILNVKVEQVDGDYESPVPLDD